MFKLLWKLISTIIYLITLSLLDLRPKNNPDKEIKEEVHLVQLYPSIGYSIKEIVKDFKKNLAPCIIIPSKQIYGDNLRTQLSVEEILDRLLEAIRDNNYRIAPIVSLLTSNTMISDNPSKCFRIYTSFCYNSSLEGLKIERERSQFFKRLKEEVVNKGLISCPECDEAVTDMGSISTNLESGKIMLYKDCCQEDDQIGKVCIDLDKETEKKINIMYKEVFGEQWK